MAMTTNSLAPFAPNAESVAAFCEHLEIVELAAGAQLFAQGDAADAVYFVERGELAVMLEVPGAGRVPVRTFGAGQSIGEMAIYRDDVRAATVEARTAVQLWRLRAAALKELERTEPAIAIAMHRRVAAMLAERVAFGNTELKEPLARLAHAIRGLATSQFSATGWDRTAVAVAGQRPDEVGAVAGALLFLETQLRTYLVELQRATAAREQIESELRIAGEIQTSFLPPPLSALARSKVDFAATMRPAREAGGDLYDGFFLDEHRFFFVIGDVSGKGVSAALFMAVTAMCLRAMAAAIPDAGELIARVNALLCQRNDTMQFVTVFMGVLDTATGELTWCDCGHPPVFLVGGTGVRERLDDRSGPPLGAFEEAQYAIHQCHVAPGETIVLYTDGVTEAMNAAEAFYGEDRLVNLLAAPAASASAQSCLDLIVNDVLAFAGTAPQADDITVVTLRRS